MVKQTRQHGYLFLFDKVNATALFLFIYLVLLSSGISPLELMNQLIILAVGNFMKLPLTNYNMNVK